MKIDVHVMEIEWKRSVNWQKGSILLDSNGQSSTSGYNVSSEFSILD